MTGPHGSTKVKLLRGPLDGREWDVVVPLPPTLDIVAEDPTGYHGIAPGEFYDDEHVEEHGMLRYRYELVHIETSDDLLPAEAHYAHVPEEPV